MYYSALGAQGERTLFEVQVAGGEPRVLLSFPDPTKQLRRVEFDASDKRLYFTIAEDESDIYMLELRKRS